MISAVWFPPQHRATATAVAYCGGSIGGALGFALGPLVIADSASHVEKLLVVEAAMAAVPFAACFAALPAAPQSGRAASAAVEVPTVAPALREWFARAAATARNPSMLTLAGIAGVQAGVNSAWGGMIPQLVASPNVAAMCGLLNGVLQLGGNLAGGAIADTVFRRRFKTALVSTFVLNACALALFALSLPSLVSPSAVLPSTAALVTMWASFAGFFQGCADPVLFELSAELTYGRVCHGAEGLSGNLLVLVWNVSALAMFFVAPLLKGAVTINAIAPATFLLAAVRVPTTTICKQP